MGWTIEHHKFENIVRVTAMDRVSTADVLAQAMEGIALIKRHKANGALIDYSTAVLEMPLEEIFKLPDLFDVMDLPRSTRMAVAVPADPPNMHKYTAFDQVASERGYVVRLFWEPTQAMTWVLTK